ncbi:MAG TPA: hypothetical protein VKT82_24395 [Ktedonobacterales bacterium]|nr:hypothetical protein [Ktedonobacterales bacterium]
MAEGDIKRYQVPTHLKINDLLTIAGFTFTFRQIAILMVGGGAAYDVGTQFPHSGVGLFLEDSVGDVGAQIVRWFLVGLLLLPTLVLTFGRYQGRTLETWGKVWLTFVTQPHRYRWRQQPDPALGSVPPRLPVTEEREDA